MDAPHEFWASQDPIDVNLYADLIVAIWRFDNPGAVRDVFPVCLALERSDAVKATAVRALLTIISEVSSISHMAKEKDVDLKPDCSQSKRFEHQPPIEPLYQQVGPQLRAVYQVSVVWPSSHSGLLTEHIASPHSSRAGPPKSSESSDYASSKEIWK